MREAPRAGRRATFEAELISSMQIDAENGRVWVVTDDMAVLDLRLAAVYRVHIVFMVVEAVMQLMTDVEFARDLFAGRFLTAAPSPGKFLAVISELLAPAGVVIVT